jgi:hypothetical protein
MDRQDGSYSSTGFIVEKWPVEGDPSRRAGIHSLLHTGGVYEVGGEVPGRSLSRTPPEIMA